MKIMKTLKNLQDLSKLNEVKVVYYYSNEVNPDFDCEITESQYDEYVKNWGSNTNGLSTPYGEWKSERVGYTYVNGFGQPVEW